MGGTRGGGWWIKALSRMIMTLAVYLRRRRCYFEPPLSCRHCRPEPDMPLKVAD